MRRISGLFFVVLLLCLVFNSSIAYTSSLSDDDRFNMTYVYFGKPSGYTALVDRTKGSLDQVAISFFDIDKSGSLVLTNKYTSSFLNDMHQRGIKVISFLSNHWDIEAGRNALNDREKLAQDVADAIDLWRLDGVNVDIEALNEQDRDDYTDFVRLLREKVSPEKEISVAVAANPFYIDKLWQGSYDYKELAKYSDYLMIMAYDESWQGSSPGPIASASFVEKSINYAIERVPKEKVVLGIPFYGRYWKSGSGYGGYGISLTDIEEMKLKHESYEFYDESMQSPYIVVNVKPEDSKTYVFGRELTPGFYTIWYENERSIKYKLSFAQKYDLKGTGSWSLGQETPDVWDYYSLWLNGKYFKDIFGHWAEEDIIKAEQKGLVNGMTSNMFYPNGIVTRAQMAALIVRMLELEDVTGEFSFKDITGHWAEKEIEIARQYGIIVGTGENKFEPEKPVTREQLTVITDRLLKMGDPVSDARKYFSDIKKDTWSYESIVRMASYKIVNGLPDGLFYPHEITTRAQMTVLINKIEKLVEEPFEKVEISLPGEIPVPEEIPGSGSTPSSSRLNFILR